MTAAYLSPLAKQRVWDNNGNPAANGTISTFAAGTTNPIATYTDSTAGTPNANPTPLNFRGECDMWLKPNIAYKLQANDVNGTLLWTIDNIVNSQLITLYGGVDTGSVNAYVLNFTASFTAYADGIIIYWIPANTNTGASTINVNGLGVVNVVNPDGSALVPSEIIANQPAQILFKGGVFELITPATTVYGSFTATWSGFSIAPGSTTIKYRKNGTLITLLMPQTLGTSNSNQFLMNGLPALLTPTVSALLGLVPIVGLVDNGTALPGGSCIALITGSIQFWKDGAQTIWTVSGNKGFNGPLLLSYSL